MPRISAVEQQKYDSFPISRGSEQMHEMKITQSVDELKKLKVADLAKLLEDLTGHQLSVPKRQRKQDLNSKVSEKAILRSNQLILGQQQI